MSNISEYLEYVESNIIQQKVYNIFIYIYYMSWDFVQYLESYNHVFDCGLRDRWGAGRRPVSPLFYGDIGIWEHPHMEYNECITFIYINY